MVSRGVHRSACAAAFGLLLICIGCADAGEADFGTAEELEQFFQAAGPEEIERLEIDLTTDCARLNGLDGYVERRAGDVAGVPVDPLPGVSGRERVEEIGTGKIALTRELNEYVLEVDPVSRSLDANDDGLSAIAQQILNTGPIVVLNSSDTYDAGCREWAHNVASSESDLLARRDLAEVYASWTTERVESSSEFAQLELQLSECMAAGGFSEAGSLNDVNDIIFEAEERWLSGQTDYETALKIDRAIGLVYYDCYEEISGDIQRLRDAAAAEFVSEYRVDLG